MYKEYASIMYKEYTSIMCKEYTSTMLKLVNFDHFTEIKQLKQI